MFDQLLELSHRDDSNKWSNIGFGGEITQVLKFTRNEVYFTHLTGALMAVLFRGHLKRPEALKFVL